MQNAMLDSIVSSNSQELSDASSALKLFENPQFRVRVIMRLGDPWFVASDACKCLELKDDAGTICRELDEQDKVTLSREEFMGGVSNRGIICSVDSRVQSLVFVSESGLYDLVMMSRKPEAKAFKRWVTHVVLPSIRKTGSYSVVQPTLAIPKTLPEALRAYADEVERREAAEKRAITAEVELSYEKEAHEKDNEDFRNGFDILNAQKAQIGSEREATAMATASAKSRECKRLTAENQELKDAVGRGTNWHTVNMMTAEWKREFGHAPSWHKLKEFSADLPKEMKPVKDVEVKVVLSNGSEKINKLFRYHREAWEKYREYEENSRVSARSRRDASNEGIGLNDTDTEIEYF